MSKNFIFILTEGSHDSAFIYRILKANGMKTNHRTAIKEYPFPLNELIRNRISSIPIEELNIEDSRSNFLPDHVMQEGDNLVSIYGIGGDSKKNDRVEFIKSINELNVPDEDAFQALKDERISVLFFFDADDKGVEKRIEQIKKELEKSEVNNIDKLKNKEIIPIGEISVGAYIFTESGKDIGKLEDVLIPLMRQGNDDIFDAAEKFLDIHETTALFRGKIAYDNAIKKKVNKKEYVQEKSLIGTVGQLQLSGASNTVCIKKADYLNDNKIKSDTTCTDIFNFINNTLT